MIEYLQELFQFLLYGTPSPCPGIHGGCVGDFLINCNCDVGHKEQDHIPNNLPEHSDNPVHQIEKQEAIQRSDTKIDDVSYFFNKSGISSSF